MADPVSPCCQGEFCHCGEEAVKKVGEEWLPGEPEENQHRHNLTAYVCAKHYAELMGPVGARQVGYDG